MVRGYLVLGLAEALTALAGYLLVWRQAGVDWSTLQTLAPQLLHGTAPAAIQAIQARAGTLAFCLIVAGQMGALLSCRSDIRPAWEMLEFPNRLLVLGLLSEPVAAGALVLLPPLAAVFGMVPFPPGWLGLMALAPLLVIGADALHKGWLFHRQDLHHPGSHRRICG